MFPPRPGAAPFPSCAVAPQEVSRLLWQIGLRGSGPKSPARSGLLQCCASAGRREGYGGSLALVPPLTETTARPRALRPQHRTHLAVRTGAEIS